MLELTALQSSVGPPRHPSPFNDIVDVLSDAIIATDRDGVVVSWNRAAETIFGRSRGEAIGLPLSQVCPPPGLEEANLLAGCLQSGKQIHQLRTHRTSEYGTQIGVFLTAIPVFDALGNAVGITHVFRPVPEAENAARQALFDASRLKRSQGDSFQAFTDAVADMLWAADAFGDTTYLGPRFVHFLGRDTAEMRQSPWLSLIVHPQDRDLVGNAWTSALQTGQRFEAEARLRRFDGIYRWFVVRGVPVSAPDGGTSEWIGSCTDIDDLKRSEQALLRSNEELKQFAYAAAHDLQEPLRNVATSVGMLRRHLGGQCDSTALQWFDASIEGAQRLHAMVKDLLTFSTILDQGQQPYVRSNLGSAFSKALAGFESTGKAEGATFHFGNLPDVGIQEQHGVEIFQNLIGNSLKYRDLDRQPVISVRAVPHDSGWLISFEDNGIGFDPAYAGLIFRVFKRLHQRTAYPGNGIGLAICQRIVAHYGGRIWAEGLPGVGAAFYFTLPGCSS